MFTEKNIDVGTENNTAVASAGSKNPVTISNSLTTAALLIQINPPFDWMHLKTSENYAQKCIILHKIKKKYSAKKGTLHSSHIQKLWIRH